MPFLKNEAVTVMRHFHLNLCDRVESYSAVKLRALPSLNHNVNKATKATAMAAIYGLDARAVWVQEYGEIEQGFGVVHVLGFPDTPPVPRLVITSLCSLRKHGVCCSSRCVGGAFLT